ncbi:multiheme c-type cytochrome [Sulfurimonas sp.]|uniref:multiheme c-type cytochrome n=2 Tax=Sulfurimonas sp. TaxID=2022749 RepID=UPI00261B2E27|nr:multiheme c-type cytochrome [Sulfurimonas sp.]
MNVFCAENSRVLEELKSPMTQIPLKSAIGEAAYNEAMASNEYRYVGNDKCRLCHRDFFIGRKHDLHDHSLEYITTSEHRDNPRCLVCHATGYGVPSGFTTIEQTPRLVNVQCEGCHGPGSNHLKIATIKKIGGGFLVGTDNHERLKKMCKACHTSRWNHSFTNANFQDAYARYKKPAPK